NVLEALGSPWKLMEDLEASCIRSNDTIKAQGTLKKSFLPPRWRLLMAQINQWSRAKTGGYDQISNKDAMILYCLENRVNIDFAKLIWDDILSKLKKKYKEEVILYPRTSLHLPMLAICNADETVAFKAPKTFSKIKKKDLKGKNHGAKSGHRKQIPISKNHPRFKIKETKSVYLSKKSTASQAGHSKKRKKSASTIVQSESASGHDALADSTAKADPGKSAPKDLLSE
nr:hypothetical protein [Tanacetum cinerariifolium]